MRIFAATSRYVQGDAALDELGLHCKVLGRSALVITDADMARLLGDRVLASFKAADVACALEVFPGKSPMPPLPLWLRTVCGSVPTWWWVWVAVRRWTLPRVSP